MAYEETRTPATPVVERERWLPADPAPLGLAGFALTTFVLSLNNAGFADNLTWVGLAFFYGGLAQFVAGIWEFANRNTFGATAFATYGAFWFALGFFIMLELTGHLGENANVENALGWYLAAFAIFNTYMMLWSTRVSAAIFMVFATLEATEILLALGFFFANTTVINIGGYVGIATAAAAWYASAAGVLNSMTAAPLLPVGRAIWVGPERPGPIPRVEEPARETR
jgi:succinate-acetate transporter protein